MSIPEVVDLLVKAGATVEARQKDGRTPLLRAFEFRDKTVETKHPDTPAKFIGHGAMSIIKIKMETQHCTFASRNRVPDLIW